MGASEAVFAIVGSVAFLLLFLSLVLGEFFGHDLEHGLDVDHAVEPGSEVAHGTGADHAGEPELAVGDLHDPSIWSFRVVAAGLVGFGGFGFLAERAGAPAVLSWPVALGGLVLVGAGTFYVVVRPMARQQFNSLLSHYSYVGRDAVVTLEILPGGSGQVTFQDRQGARVTRSATSDGPAAVAKGALVRIVDVGAGGVVVHRNALDD